MAETRKVRDEDFPVEVAFWETNKEELSKQYPGKYLIIRGEEVQEVLDTIEEVRLADQQELMDNPALVRHVDDGKTIYYSYFQATDRA